MGKYSCHIVDSVKEMKKINVREGDVVKTLGYYSINDDGAAEYIIKDTSITSDEASIILLDSGLQAHLVVKREMNLEVFGGKGDALATKPTDNSKAHNKAMNALEKVSGKLILTGGKSYGFANTSYFPYNVGFDGGWSRIIPLPGGNFNKNFMFFINANLDGSIIKPWGGDYIIETGYTVFENYYKIKDIQAWYSKGRTIFKPMTYIGFYKGILKEGENDKDYSDFLTITNQKFSNCEGRSALIDIKYNGDALAIHNCTVDGYPSNNYNLIYIYGCNSGEIQNCVNGNITINSCLGLTINTFHCEHGNIQCINSVVILRNIVHWWNSYYQPIPLTIRNDAIDSVTGTSIVENYTVCYVQEGVGIGSKLKKDYITGDSIDAFFKNASIKVLNFSRKYFSKSDSKFGMQTGIKISTDGTQINAEWEKGSQIYSKESYLVDTQFFSPITEIMCDKNIVAYKGAITDHGEFDEEIGTYYYQAIFYFGYLDRKIARWGGNEFQITINKQTDFPLLNFANDYTTQNSILRLYRGNASKSYSEYVDIPIVNGLKVYDQGFFVSTGERWKKREKIDSVEQYNNFRKIKILGKNITVYGEKLPTKGYWKEDDLIIIKSNSSFVEYMCMFEGDFDNVPPIFVKK